jgi:lysophospholipid acyltransferase (LPLAT)-like uncharacterized protein
VARNTDKVYDFAPLDVYSWTERLAIRVIDIVCYLGIRLIGATVRFEVEGWENYEKVEVGGRRPILSFWHARIFLSTLFFRNRGIVVITSKSKDGEYIARFIQRFGFGAIRGSSSRGAARALIEMKRVMAEGRAIGITVDGPRGPRREAKPGAVYLAKLTGNPILPFQVEPESCWILNTWDRMQIPKPFSKALITIAEPIYVSGEADEDEVERKVAELQSSLDALVPRGLDWSGRTDCS